MKKILLILSIAGFYSSTKSMAQSWAIAPTLGMNFSTARVSNDGKVSDDHGYRSGFSIGATAEYLWKPKLYFRPAVNLASSRGDQSAVYQKVNETTYENEAKITYFDLIADLKYGFGETERLFAVGGLYYGLALSGTYVVTTTPKGGDSDSNSDGIDFGSEDNEHCGWDAGLGLGLGYRLNVSNRPLEIVAKYSLGLINQSNADKVTNYSRFFSIGVSYYLFEVGSGSAVKTGGSESKPAKKKGVVKDEEL